MADSPILNGRDKTEQAPQPPTAAIAEASATTEYHLLKAINEALLHLLSEGDKEVALRSACEMVGNAIQCEGVVFLKFGEINEEKAALHTVFCLVKTEEKWNRWTDFTLELPLEDERTRTNFYRVKDEGYISITSRTQNGPNLSQILEQIGVGSYFSCRIMIDGQVWGVGTFASRSTSLDWVEDNVKIVVPFLQSVGNYLARREAQEALKNQHDYFKQIIDVCPNPIFARNRQGIFTTVNRAMATPHHLDPEEMIGRNIRDFLPSQQEAAEILKEDAEIIASGAPIIDMLKELTTVNGKRYLQISKMPIVNNKGEIQEVVSVLTDLTELKQAEQALEKQRDYLRKILDLNPNLIFAKDTSGCYTLANQALAENIYGITPQEMLGKTDLELTRYVEETQVFMQADQQVIQSRQTNFYPITKITDSKGEQHYLQTTLVPLLNESAVCEEVFGVSVDITAIKKTERQLLKEKYFSESITSLIPDWILILNPVEEKVIYHNILDQILGYDIAEISDVYAFLGNHLHPDDVDLVINFVKKVQQARDEEILEKYFRLQHKDGRWLYYYERTRVFSRHADGTMKEFLALIQDVTNQVETQQQIERSERRYRNFINYSQEGIYYMNCGKPISIHVSSEEMSDSFYKNAYIDECNASFATMYGSSIEHIKGMPALHFHGGEHFEENVQSFRDLIKNDFRVSNVETIEPDMEGNLKYFLNSAVGIIENEHLVGFWGTQLDITERKEAEKALHTSEAWANLIFDSTTDLMFLMEIEPNDVFRCVRVNPAYLKQTGLTSDHLLGKTPEEILPQKEARFVLEHYQEAIQRKEAINYEETVLLEDGPIVVETSLVPIFDANEQPVYLLGVARDISARKKAEEQLRLSEQRWKFAIEGSNDGIWDWNVVTGEGYLSPRWKSMLGFEDAEIQNNVAEWSKRVHPDDLKPAMEQMKKHFRRETPVYFVEHRLLCKDETYKWILSKGKVLVWNEDGSPARMVGTHTDIAERKRTQQREQSRSHVLELLSKGASQAAILEAIVLGAEQHEPGMISSIMLLDEEGKHLWTAAAPNLPDFYTKAIDGAAIDMRVGSCGIAIYTGERIIVEDIQTHPYWTDHKQLAEKAGLRSSWSEPIKDSAGKTLGCFAIYHKKRSIPTEYDIEVIKQAADLTSIVLHKFHAEAVLKASEEKFYSMVHNISDIITLLDKNGIIIYQSSSIMQVLGFDEYELLGKNIFELLHPDDHVFIAQEFNNILSAEGNGNLIEFRFLNKAGTYTHLEARGNNQLHNAAIKGIIVNSRDVTERKQTEHALQENRSILKAIVNALPDLKFRVNKTGRFLDYYESEYENEPPIVPPAAFIGKTMEEVLPSFVAEVGMRSIQFAIEDKRVQTFEYCLPMADEFYYYEGRVSPISEEEVIVGVRNISDQKKAQLALQDKLRELDEKNKQLTQYIESNFQLENFAYIASHDLREPVRTMHSFAQLLKKRYTPLLDEDGQRCLDFIIYGSENMNQLIEDLLTYSRVSSEEHKVKTVELRPLLEDIKDSLTRFIQEKNARIELNELPLYMEANPTTIRQLFQNLLVNGIKFHHPDKLPIIEVSGIDYGDYWLFEVKDNGIGIPKDMQERIFQLFKKIHYVKEHQGTGIGLAISKRIAEQHRGEIWVESSPENGSSFYVTIKKQQLSKDQLK